MKEEKKYNLLNCLLKQRLSLLQKNISIIKQRIDMYPEGHLKINKVKDEFYYCVFDERKGKRRYIKKDSINEAKLIAQRDYDNDYLKCAEKELWELKKWLKQDYSDQTKKCYENLHPGRKCLVLPFEISDEEYISRWLSVPYSTKGFKEDDNCQFYTERGERVRSKSEVIIANILDNMNVPYKYECPLKLDNTTVYPDFTILDVREKCEKYIEHFGMMGDMDYVSNMMLKINTYERNGIYLGDKLICTFESIKRPLNVKVLTDKVHKLLDIRDDR